LEYPVILCQQIYVDFGSGITYKVSSDEVLIIKRTIGVAPCEYREVLGQSNQDAEEESDVRADETKGRSVGHLILGNALGPACAHEPDMRYQKRNPGQESKDGGQIDKVAKDGFGVVCHIHEGSAAEQCRNSQRRDRNSSLVGPKEDLRGVTLDGESIDGTGGNVQIRVGSTECEEQDAGVDDGRKVGNLGNLDGNNKGRGRSTSGGLVGKGKLLGVVRYNHAQEENGQTVEEENPVKGELDGAWNSLARILCFTNSDTDKLSTEVGEDGIDQGAPEAIKFALTSGSNVWFEGTRIVVVLEASCRARTGADGQQEGQENDANDGDDFDGTQPEFQLTKELDTKVVDGANGKQEDGDPNTRIDFLSGFPFLNNQSRSGQLVGRCDDIFGKIAPTGNC
jgi:hypothetical protein